MKSYVRETTSSPQGNALGRQRYFHDLRTHILVDLEVLRFLEIGASPGFPCGNDLKIVLAGFDIAGKDSLHRPLLQGFQLLEGIKVTGNRRAVQLDLDRIETEGFAAG